MNSFALRVQDPNNKVLGPKHYNVNGIWALKPYSLGPWTLRVVCAAVHNCARRLRRSEREFAYDHAHLHAKLPWYSQVRI